uniref:Uncharacterized protein n=1 Tax=Phage sp. ctIHi3 TaxID=2825791 RepID=A0A8S5Q5R4_9VIRU|nr:MAG TPA: hypothetical protein [Phage sp. ctIHi3]
MYSTIRKRLLCVNRRINSFSLSLCFFSLSASL